MDKKGCLKRTGIGCGVMFLVLLLIVGISAAKIYFNPVKQANVQMSTLDDPIPQSAEQPTGLLGQAPPKKKLGVHLNVEYAEIIVKRGDQLEGIRVEGNFDQSNFDLTTSMTEKDNQNDYHLDFKSKRSVLAMMYQEFQRYHQGQGDSVTVPETKNTLTIYMPAGVPLAFDYKLSKGEWTFDLNGLSVAEFKGESGLGKFQANMDTPNPIPMENLIVDFSKGESRWTGLQNLNFKKASFEGSMGNMNLSADQPLTQDAEIWTSMSMGDCNIELPPDVNIQNDMTVTLGDQHTRLPNETKPEWPTLTLKGNSTMGSLRLVHPDSASRFISQLKTSALNHDVEEMNRVMVAMKAKCDSEEVTYEVNDLGYHLLRRDHIQSAIEVFKMNTVYFPDYGNGFDSLGEAYFDSGDWENAKASYQVATEKLRDPSGAKRMLERIAARSEGKVDPGEGELMKKDKEGLQDDDRRLDEEDFVPKPPGPPPKP